MTRTPRAGESVTEFVERQRAYLDELSEFLHRLGRREKERRRLLGWKETGDALDELLGVAVDVGSRAQLASLLHHGLRRAVVACDDTFGSGPADRGSPAAAALVAAGAIRAALDAVAAGSPQQETLLPIASSLAMQAATTLRGDGDPLFESCARACEQAAALCATAFR